MFEQFYLILANGMYYEVSEDDFWKVMRNYEEEYGLFVEVEETLKDSFFYYHNCKPFALHKYTED